MESNLMNLQRIKIYTNESVQVAIAEGLKRRAMDARSCRDVGNHGLTDEQQLDYACRNSLVIFTHDDDFLKLSAKYMAQGKKHPGIIYSHQKDYSIGECIRRIKIIVDVLSPEEMRNHIEFL
jgi:predicted nuclease of predicted toxin-antitoxin system